MTMLRTWKVVVLASVAIACSGPSGQADEAPPAGTMAAAPAQAPPAGPAVRLERVTPVLAVDDIEPVVPFWEALGFTAANPGYRDGAMVFIAFIKDGLEIHYQTLARIEQDSPQAAESLAGSTSMLYLTVDDLDGVVGRLGDAEVVVPRRRTTWGSEEIYVREPGGHIVAFAAFGSN